MKKRIKKVITFGLCTAMAIALLWGTTSSLTDVAFASETTSQNANLLTENDENSNTDDEVILHKVDASVEMISPNIYGGTIEYDSGNENPRMYAPGDLVKIYLHPDKHYTPQVNQIMATYIVDSTLIHKGIEYEMNDEYLSFVMPDADVIINIAMIQDNSMQVIVYMPNSGGNYSFERDDASDSRFFEGDKVTLLATPELGYQIGEVIVYLVGSTGPGSRIDVPYELNDNRITFTMPNTTTYVTLPFEEIPLVDISEANVSEIEDVIYTGSAVTPSPVIKYDGKELVVDTDYTLSYENNDKVETGTVIITGKGNFTGSISKTFTIKSAQPKWVEIDNRWKYQKADGTYKTSGWAKISGKWYYFDKDGWMQTGWVKDAGKWYYMNGSGAMVTGWVKTGGKWYYMNGSGAMTTGWQKVSGKWYYMSGSGAMTTGWQKISGKWYYFNNSGAMQTGWIKVDGKDYYLYSDGHMAASTWIGKYYVNASGVWTKTK